MPRPNQTHQRRQEFLPIVARTFAEFGYRRTTTAALARRCAVRENVLYRLWTSKKAMFIAALEHVYESSRSAWKLLLAARGCSGSTAERLLAYEASHHGESGMYRIVFAGLSETDDPEIRNALQQMYARFHRFIQQQIAAHHDGGRAAELPTAALTAWAIVGLGTVADISRELGLLNDPRRKRLLGDVGRHLLAGSSK
ncbi:MAG: TetR/AcrR family transcriptional regulator [Planctomycetes bacterium]|nr:TetR/AcrR family transcriptional regulator [Planctomycetota bacterium]